MDLDFLNQVGKNIKNSLDETINKIEISNKENIDEVELDLANKLDAIIEYTIDRFEGNIAVCENRKTGEIVNIEKEKLPNNLNTGDIFLCINGKYTIDLERQKEVKKRIKNKMDDLWN